MKTESLDKWLSGIGDDEARAKVIQTHIAETEKTKRDVAASLEVTRQTEIKGDGYNFVRIAWPIAILSCGIASSCVAGEYVKSLQVNRALQIRAEHPASFPVDDKPCICEPAKAK